MMSSLGTDSASSSRDANGNSAAATADAAGTGTACIATARPSFRRLTEWPTQVTSAWDSAGCNTR